MTPHERYQRGIDLAGEIKQADALVAECEHAVLAASKALDLANAAYDKQIEAREAKYAEARTLAQEAADHFYAMVPGSVLTPNTPTPVLAIVTPESYDDETREPLSPYPNGESRINSIFERATNP